MEKLFTPIMSAENITKVYPGTIALKDVDFDIMPGCVNVLVGENGAGKTTLMKILAGIEKPTKGKIFLEGRQLVLNNTREASDLGVSIIHQELNMFPDMRVSDNMFAGNELSRFGIVERKEQDKRAKSVLASLKQGIATDRMMRKLRAGREQIIEIEKTVL